MEKLLAWKKLPSRSKQYASISGIFSFHPVVPHTTFPDIARGSGRSGELNGGIYFPQPFRIQVFLIMFVYDKRKVMTLLSAQAFYGFAHLSVSDQSEIHMNKIKKKLLR